MTADYKTHGRKTSISRQAATARKFTSQPRGAIVMKSLDREGLPDIGAVNRTSATRKLKIRADRN